MSRERIKTIPNLADTSPKHQAALVAGDEHFRLWERNVIDDFKSLSEEQIRKKLQESSFPYAVCFENWINDFNISTGIRNANAFGAREIYYLGDKKFDRRGMQGVQNYSTIQWLPTMDDFLSLRDKYIFVGVDNIPGAIPINDYTWKDHTLMIFGSEGVGLTPGIQSVCQDLVFVRQFGSVRSLNVGTASGIVMNDFVSKLI